jgi:hypothetical protein
MQKPLAHGWTARERRRLQGLASPAAIQGFLNAMPYDTRPGCRSPRWVMRERRATCFEGALFATAALRRLGNRPLLVDLRAWNDDDHVIALFMRDGHWGDIAKSNVPLLRFREPVYRSLRELVMSYFDLYFNTVGQKALRSYSRPLDVSRYDDRAWETTDEDLEYIGDRLDALRHYPLLTRRMIRTLVPVDATLFRAGLLGAVKAGLYRARRDVRET